MSEKDLDSAPLLKDVLRLQFQEMVVAEHFEKVLCNHLERLSHSARKSREERIFSVFMALIFGIIAGFVFVFGATWKASILPLLVCVGFAFSAVLSRKNENADGDAITFIEQDLIDRGFGISWNKGASQVQIVRREIDSREHDSF